MANRPVYSVSLEGNIFVEEHDISFKWFSGFSKEQKQKSISSLHNEYRILNQHKKVLEISTSSDKEIGVRLSAFNLMIKDSKMRDLVSVECLFQASKKFENGGPYKDLLNKTSLEAKKDPRLRTSGELEGFVYKNKLWALEPKTLFYDWIYINTLHQNKSLAEEIVSYDAFTDIEFNPQKSINCQAKSAALYVSLCKRGILENVLNNSQFYINLISSSTMNQTSFIK